MQDGGHSTVSRDKLICDKDSGTMFRSIRAVLGMTGGTWCWLLLISASCLAGQGSGVTWPQWRGPTRDATLSAEPWPSTLQKDRLELTWRKALGPSYSGPIVASDRVFVTETADAEREVVRALDLADGQELWRAEWQGAMKVPFFAASNGSWIRATPAYDGNSLYVAGMKDVLVCLDAKSGSERWRVDFVQRLGSPKPAFGFVSSPLVLDDAVYVQAGASFMKLDKASGDIVWRSLQDAGGMWGSAFSSPTYAELHGEGQLLVQTRTRLAGVSPIDGAVLWSEEIPAFRGMNILTPCVIGDAVFTSSYGGRSRLLRCSKGVEKWQVEEAWTSKVQGYMSSPVVSGNFIFLHLRNQRLVCLDARSGEVMWTTRPFGKYWSMIRNGDKILALDQRGELLLIRANPQQFELLDRRKVGTDSWAHVAACGNRIFIRDLEALAVYRWQ